MRLRVKDLGFAWYARTVLNGNHLLERGQDRNHNDLRPCANRGPLGMLRSAEQAITRVPVACLPSA